MGDALTEDPFYQQVHVDIGLREKSSPGNINRILKEAGATFYYDVYGFRRADSGPTWQSECYADVELFCDGRNVGAQSTIDRLVLRYPLATIGSEYISRFADTAFKLASEFGSEVLFGGIAVERSELIEQFETTVTKLMEEWGEEPGSEDLRIMIEQSYPR